MRQDLSGEARHRGGRARWFILFPLLHLGACAADLMTEQVAVTGLLCTGSDKPLLTLAAAGLVLALFLALPLGFLAIRYRRLRPLYLVLLALVPVTILGIDRLVAARILTCDLP